MNNKKVVFLSYIPSPYRVDFFNELNKKVNLKVIFHQRYMDNSPWRNDIKNLDFEHTFLFDESKAKGLYNLYLLLRLHKDDIIIIGGYYLLPEIFTIFYCSLFRKKFVLSSDGGFVTKGFFKTKFKKFLISSASHWMSSGINTSNTLRYYGAKSENIFEYHFTTVFKNELINNWPVRDEIYKLREKLDLAPNFLYMIFVGQLVHRKGVDVLIEALKLGVNQNIRTIIVGSGDQEQKLKQMVLDSKLDSDTVIFLGKLSKNDVLKYLRISDFFVFPSREDIWGLVLNEAIAYGLPIISTRNVGSAYSLIDEGKNGYMIDIDNPKDLQYKINLIAAGDLEVMKKSSLLKAKKYTIEQMVSDHMALFDKYIYEKH